MLAINEMPMARRKREVRRVRRTVTNGGLAGNIPNGTTDSIWFGWQTMEERNPSGGTGGTDTPLKQYIWGSYIDECLQLNLLAVAGPQQLAVGVYYPLQDTLYRTMALANSSGAVVGAYDTDAYGNTLIFTGPGPDNTWFTDDDTQSSYGANGIIYQGRALDAESALYYFRTRYYSPALGRFTNRNPWGYIQGRQNLYDFEKESPTRYVEPLSAAVAVAVDVLLGVTVLAVVTLAVARSRHVPIRIPGGAICGEPPDPCPGLRTAFAPAMAKYARAAVAAVKAEISFQNEAWVYEAQGTYAVHLDLVQAAQEGAAQAYLAALKAYQSLEEQGC